MGGQPKSFANFTGCQDKNQLLAILDLLEVLRKSKTYILPNGVEKIGDESHGTIRKKHHMKQIASEFVIFLSTKPLLLIPKILITLRKCCLTSLPTHSSAFDELTMLDVGPSRKKSQKNSKGATKNSKSMVSCGRVLLGFPRKLLTQVKLLRPQNIPKALVDICTSGCIRDYHGC